MTSKSTLIRMYYWYKDTQIDQWNRRVQKQTRNYISTWFIKLLLKKIFYTSVSKIAIVLNTNIPNIHISLRDIVTPFYRQEKYKF